MQRMRETLAVEKKQKGQKMKKMQKMQNFQRCQKCNKCKRFNERKFCKQSKKRIRVQRMRKM